MIIEVLCPKINCLSPKLLDHAGFEIYDEDGNGWLSRDELEKILRTVMDCT